MTRTYTGTLRTLAQMLCALTLVFALATSLPQRAYAAERIDEGESGSLALACTYDRTPVAGLSFSLWQIATFTDTGAYKLAASFADAGIAPSSLTTASQWDAAAKQAVSFAREQSVPPLAQATSISDGTAFFPNVKPGLYLVSEASADKDGLHFATAPCLIAVPQVNPTDDSWIYQVVAEPKMEQSALPASDRGKKQDWRGTTLSKTGDQMGVAVLTAGGVLVAFGILCVIAYRKVSRKD